MKNKKSMIFDAQIFSDLCDSKEIHSCAIVTSLKKDHIIHSFCETFCIEMKKVRENVEFFVDDVFLNTSTDTLSLVLAPSPHENVDSYRICKSCDAVLIVERYGHSLHYVFDEMIVFLREHNFDILGVISITD